MNPTLAPAILIVDDEPMVLLTLKTVLTRANYQVTTAERPTEALKLVEAANYAVIISDHRMPEMTGLDFLAHCRRLCPASSRILLTAVLNLHEVMEAIDRDEICRFLAKPWLREELLAAVGDAVQRNELTVRNAALRKETERLNALLVSAGISQSEPSRAG
jgi:DNA-binding NtrC family response regulator